MIFRIVYGGERLRDENGQSKKVPINPKVVLSTFGPMLDVMIFPPILTCKNLEADGKDIPSCKARALIDTGASSSVIHPDVAAKLGLVHTGYQNITSVQNTEKQPVYFGTMAFSWGARKELPLIACPLTNVQCLIGRDVLQHWYLTYDGGGGTIVICD